jgi:hypothetical protein
MSIVRVGAAARDSSSIKDAFGTSISAFESEGAFSRRISHKFSELLGLVL